MSGIEHLQPKPDFYKYQNLMLDIEKGKTQIPKFQRDFVWGKQKSAELIDSILKGYPIGTFILWRTKERLRSVKRLGNQDLPAVSDGDFVQYVLDGQQRLASLYVITNGLIVEKGNKNEDYKNIYIDLEKQEDDENIVSIDEPSGMFITVYDLLHKGIADLANEYKNQLEKIQAYQRSLHEYDFSIILLNGYPMEKAVEVFTRINTTGKALTLFEIMSAKTFDEQRFDLSDKYNSLKVTLEHATYEIPPPQLLQCIAVNLTNECKRRVILGLDRNDIIKIWDETIGAIKKAVDHFKHAYNIPTSSLLPYPALLVPFSYFFYKNGGAPTAQQDTYLKEYFWRAALTSRFTSSVESKLALDCKFMDAILAGNRPSYGENLNVTLTEKSIRNLQFRTNESVNRAVLCVMTAARPRSFMNNVPIVLDNSGLSRSNSKNYHHFFPKKFLEKQNVDNSKINLIANMTLVDDHLNKTIKDNPPSKYMKEFLGKNSCLADTMKTHLIDNLQTYGVWNDDYDAFIRARSARIWTELKARYDPI